MKLQFPFPRYILAWRSRVICKLLYDTKQMTLFSVCNINSVTVLQTSKLKTTFSPPTNSSAFATVNLANFTIRKILCCSFSHKGMYIDPGTRRGSGRGAMRLSALQRLATPWVSSWDYWFHMHWEAMSAVKGCWRHESPWVSHWDVSSMWKVPVLRLANPRVVFSVLVWFDKLDSCL